MLIIKIVVFFLIVGYRLMLKMNCVGWLLVIFNVLWFLMLICFVGEYVWIKKVFIWNRLFVDK